MKKIFLLSITMFVAFQTQAFKGKIHYGLSVLGGTNYTQLSGGSDFAHEEKLNKQTEYNDSTATSKIVE